MIPSGLNIEIDDLKELYNIIKKMHQSYDIRIVQYRVLEESISFSYFDKELNIVNPFTLRSSLLTEKFVDELFANIYFIKEVHDPFIVYYNIITDVYDIYHDFSHLYNTNCEMYSFDVRKTFKSQEDLIRYFRNMKINIKMMEKNMGTNLYASIMSGKLRDRFQEVYDYEYAQLTDEERLLIEIGD